MECPIRCSWNLIFTFFYIIEVVFHSHGIADIQDIVQFSL